MIIPIPIFWTKYTATAQGSVVKLVRCEHCTTEYVYLMERQSIGVGTSIYSLDNEGASHHARSGADDTLTSLLENDFDPIPCPVCGSYQRFMFPKLMETKSMRRLLVGIALAMFFAIASVTALRHSLAYRQLPTEEALHNMVLAWSVALVVGFLGFSLAVAARIKMRRFEPNRTDLDARLTIARNLAVTRAEFEAAEKTKKLCVDQRIQSFPPKSER